MKYDKNLMRASKDSNNKKRHFLENSNIKKDRKDITHNNDWKRSRSNVTYNNNSMTNLNFSVLRQKDKLEDCLVNEEVISKRSRNSFEKILKSKPSVVCTETASPL